MKKTIITIAALVLGTMLINKAMPLTEKETLEDYEPTSVWEHYCIMDLNKLPEEATSEEYDYFLDAFAGTDGYEELLEVYGK